MTRKRNVLNAHAGSEIEHPVGQRLDALKLRPRTAAVAREIRGEHVPAVGGKVTALQCPDTVSYTHLDVYKRQHSISVNRAPARSAASSMAAVSYTHLMALRQPQADDCRHG